MWTKLILIIGAMWLLQGFFTFFQVKNVQNKFMQMHQKGNVGVGNVKGKLGPGAIIILSGNQEGTIIDAQIMSGMTVFTRFKPITELCGQHYMYLDSSIFYSSKSKTEALRKATDNLRDTYKGNTA